MLTALTTGEGPLKMGGKVTALRLTVLNVLAFATLVFTALNIVHQVRALRRFTASQRPTYTYVDHDIPSELPGDFGEAAMIMSHSDRYNLSDDQAWASTLATQRGFVRLGKRGRPFAVSLYHQLHCLNSARFIYSMARDGLPLSDDHIASFGHMDHCFQFLRQTILCNADPTLEQATGSGNVTASSLHRCRDWVAVREFVEGNYALWREVPYGME